MGLLSTTTVHHHHETPRYPQTVNVHNAPAVEQARLLAELEAAALDRIVMRATLENHAVNARMLVERDPVTQGSRAMVCFTLNGRDISFSYPMGDRELLLVTNPHDVARIVTERLAAALAAELVRVSVGSWIQTVRPAKPEPEQVVGTPGMSGGRGIPAQP